MESKKNYDSIHWRSYSKYETTKALIQIAVLCQTFCFITGYFSSQYLSIPFFWLELMYILGGSLGTLTHYVGHRRIFNRWYQAHTMEHHIHLYPAKRFLSETPKYAKDNNAKYYIPTILFPFVLTSIFYGDDPVAVILSGTWIILWLAFVDILHTEFHLRGSRLERFNWFHILRNIHLLHHKGKMQSNLGILDFSLEVLTGNLALG